MSVGAADRRKLGFEEGAKLMYSDSSLEVVIDNKIEGTVSATEYGIRKGPDGEVMGTIHGSTDRSKLGRYSLGKALG